MKLDLCNLPPCVADVLRARMWSMRFDHHARPEDAGLRAVLARRWKGVGWRVLGAAALGGAIVGGIVALSGAHGAALKR